MLKTECVTGGQVWGLKHCYLIVPSQGWHAFLAELLFINISGPQEGNCLPISQPQEVSFPFPRGDDR